MNERDKGNFYEDSGRLEQRSERTGTREWSDVSENLVLGCRNNCRYCYARAMALRFGRIKSAAEWPNMVLNDRRFTRVTVRPPKYPGVVMFPTTHDIFPEHIEKTVIFLRSLLGRGNRLLIVSKPRLECIQRLCDGLANFSEQVEFRFTIGADNDRILNFWEPGAPRLEERVASLEEAYMRGFKTSISMEPLLCDARGVIESVKVLGPRVTGKIWIGLLNRLEERVNCAGMHLVDYREFVTFGVEAISRPDSVKDIYAQFKDDPKIAWKDSIRRIVGIRQ